VVSDDYFVVAATAAIELLLRRTLVRLVTLLSKKEMYG